MISIRRVEESLGTRFRAAKRSLTQTEQAVDLITSAPAMRIGRTVWFLDWNTAVHGRGALVRFTLSKIVEKKFVTPGFGENFRNIVPAKFLRKIKYKIST
jgi:hypothetical protein